MTDGVFLDENTPYEGGHLLHNLLLFGRLCRALGMDISPNRMMEVAHALEYIELGRKRDVYDAMRCLMVDDPREFEKFDQAFDLFWRRPMGDKIRLDIAAMTDASFKEKTQLLLPTESEPSQSDGENKAPTDPEVIAAIPTYSNIESLRFKAFSDMTVQEMQTIQQVINQLPPALGQRRTRRFRAGRGQRIDMRRLLRRHGISDDIHQFPKRVARFKPRPVVLICDISGSMERYTRILLHFAHTLSTRVNQVESFVYSTQLWRITRRIRRKSIDAALKDVGRSITGWGGGTATGESLHDFNYHWSRRVLGRGAIVILITDGWDRGDVDTLRKEIDRLQRSCYRLIWLNPLIGTEGYEPLTRGSQAMLPYVDDFLPIRNLANLDVIVKELQKVDWRRPNRTPHAKYIVP